MKRIVNDDPRCAQPNDCKARGGALCRGCHFAHLPPTTRSPEVRAKMSAARKKAWADPEVRAKMSAARKKAWADPEVRAKMSAASKKALADRHAWCPEPFLPAYYELVKKVGAREARRVMELEIRRRAA